ncbi:MAG: N-acetylmuramoyl-L-alanine amidase [Rhodobacteraceae bacterium]|nr:N-acetylmuramoyl-L-alanine amidase [Paracoccaceae bacterium]
MKFPASLAGVLTALALWAGQAAGADLDSAASRVVDAGEGIRLELALSAPLAYRAFLLDAPPRLVVDFFGDGPGRADVGGVDRSGRVVALGWGPIRAGWSRLVAQLDGPYRLSSAEERPDGAARLVIRLDPATPEDFVRLTAKHAEENGPGAMPQPAAVAKARRRQTGDAPLIVVLDPGHGGIDPGAEAGGASEAAIVLAFATELAAMLRRDGMSVVLTRQADVFVPLEARISIARAAGADVFLSLHADALAEGVAQGATVYTLSDKASDRASALLAQRHDRADLLAGVDLAGQDDVLAAVMMDMSRTETQPRSDRLARTLAASISAAGIRMLRHPIQQAGFSVLKSPDIPSVLLEAGFLSSRSDRARLEDPEWRKSLQMAIAAALRKWAVADAAEARLIRQ